MSKTWKDRLEELYFYDENVETPLEIEPLNLGPISDEIALMDDDVKQLDTCTCRNPDAKEWEIVTCNCNVKFEHVLKPTESSYNEVEWVNGPLDAGK